MGTDFSLAQMLGKSAPMIDVVDVGAMGLEGADCDYAPLLKTGLCRVVGFEPVQAECDKLNARAPKNCRYLPYFIGDGSAGTFHLMNYSMTSSLFEPDSALLSRFNNLEELTRVQQKFPVQTRRLDDIPEITNIDLLKIDVQGAELATFIGAQRLLADALVIFTEVEFVPMYKNQPLFADVDTELRRQGFLLHTFSDSMLGRAFKPVFGANGPYGRINQILWSDAIFVRHFMHLETLSAEKLLKLAIIMHDLCKSFDLVNLILQAYDRVSGKKLWKFYMTRLTAQDPGDPPAYL